MDDFSKKIKSTVTSLIAVFSGISNKNSSLNFGFNDRSATFVRFISYISNGPWKITSTYVSKISKILSPKKSKEDLLYQVLVIIVLLVND